MLRTVLGVGLAAAGLFADLQVGWALLLFGAGMALLFTALARYCPVSAVLRR